MGRAHRLHQGFRAGAVERRQSHGRHAPGLRQCRFEPVGQAAQRGASVFDHVPFVDRDHQGAALVERQPGDGEVLLVEDGLGLDHQDHHMAPADGIDRVRGCQFLHRVGDARAAAQPGGIDQHDRLAAMGGGDGDGVARDAGLGTGEHALLAQQPVDQRRFADIGAADDGDADRPVGRVGLLGVFRGFRTLTPPLSRERESEGPA